MISHLIRFPILAAVLSIAPAAAESPKYAYNNVVDVGTLSPGPVLSAYIRFLAYAEAGAKAVTLRIDSPGGSVFLGYRFMRAVEDLKKTHGIRVTCVVDGMAYSMAAVLLESPVCDLRLATVRSTVLFHNGSGSVDGNARDMESARKFLEALNTSMALVVSGRIGVPLSWYRARIATDAWVMAVPEALMSNVLDGIASPEEIAPPVAGPKEESPE